MFNTIYIHAGFPKTGSSFLQNAFDMLSLNNNFQIVNYPTTESNVAYTGNGNKLASLLVNELFPTFNQDELAQELELLIERCNSFGKDLLISSEQFFSASPERFEYFKCLVSKYTENIKLIFVVREFDSWCYSYYIQLVKRHGLSSGFSLEWLSKFEIDISDRLQNITQFNLDSIIIPYSTKGLLPSFLKVIGEDTKISELISDVVVNRSLNARELTLLERVNSIFNCERLSTMVSDEFIRLDEQPNSESISLNSFDFYPSFREAFKEKILVSDSPLINEIGLGLFPEKNNASLALLSNREVSDEVLLDAVLSMIKRWMDESGDLFKIKNYASKHLMLTDHFFDPIHYLIINNDVLRQGVDPWSHYQNHCKNEGRKTAYILKDFDLTGF